MGNFFLRELRPQDQKSENLCLVAINIYYVTKYMQRITPFLLKFIKSIYIDTESPLNILTIVLRDVQGRLTARACLR